MPHYRPEYDNSGALVIGINEYQEAAPLGYARDDAKALARVLEQRFEFPPEHITVLLDGEATKEAILGAYLGFATDMVHHDDRIVVFFAGHGFTRRGARGEVGFLTPVDGSNSDLGSLIRWDELTRNADLIEAKHMLFIMDACYGGLAITRALPAGSTRFLKDMLQRYSRQVLTAGKADETVADSGGPLPNHSVFTGHLIRGLEGDAASNDGIITANAVMSYVYEKVAKDQHSRQTPHYGFVAGDGDLVFIAPPLKALSEKPEIDEDVLISVPAALPGGLSDGVTIEEIQECLSDPRLKIRLDNIITRQVRDVLPVLSEGFPVQGQNASVDELIDRLQRYESTTAALRDTVTAIAYWGDSDHRPLLRKAIVRLAEAIDPSGGLVAWLALRWYPVMVLTYSAGISALAAENHAQCAAILTATVEGSSVRDESKDFVLALGEGITEMERADVFKRIPEHERNYVPRSEYLFKLLQPRLDDILFLGNSYEALFDKFELLFALVHADMNARRSRGSWGPLGRFGWKYHAGGRASNPVERLKQEVGTKGESWEPISAGLFDGSKERFDEVLENFEQRIKKLNWY